MHLALTQDVPQIPGMTVDAELVVGRHTEVVAIITVSTTNQQLPTWFKQAAEEVKPLHVQRMGTSGSPQARRRQARVLVVISTKGFERPEDAIMAFLRGALRMVEERRTAKTTAAKPQIAHIARPRRLAGPPSYRPTPRHQLAFR
jgi:hypothetical protein